MFATRRTPSAGPGKSKASIVNTPRGYAIYVPSTGSWMKPDLGTVSGESPFDVDGRLKESFKLPADAVAFRTYDAARTSARQKYEV